MLLVFFILVIIIVLIATTELRLCVSIKDMSFKSYLKINDNEYHDEYNSILLGENGPWHMSLFDIDIDMQ